MKIIDDIAQGSDAWHEYRIGAPTASNFSKILAKGQGKTRRSYLIQKCAEILTGKPTATYQNDDMLRGVEQEPEARALYSFERGVDVSLIGLAMLDDKSAVCSPDGLVGDDGLLEIKSVLPHVHIETILSGKMPPQHMAQVQGNLWILERDWLDFISYSPLVKDRPMVVYRIEKDDSWVSTLATEINQFNLDLKEMVEKIKEIKGV